MTVSHYEVYNQNFDQIIAKRIRAFTNFQPSGSKQAVILVLIPGKGPGSSIIFPPNSLIASALL